MAISEIDKTDALGVITGGRGALWQLRHLFYEIMFICKQLETFKYAVQGSVDER
jgi:hypothetical protein